MVSQNKINECRHEICKPHLIVHKKTTSKDAIIFTGCFFNTGLGRFELPNAGIKILCLTAWR